jgi:hypothetical protein
LSSIHTKLSKLSLQDTVAFFDTNQVAAQHGESNPPDPQLCLRTATARQDGFVSFDELNKVMSTYAMGLPEEAVASLTHQLLRGQDAMRTSDLLDIGARVGRMHPLRTSRPMLPCCVSCWLR